MKRTAHENLESWEVPDTHLGGAGLHYPRIGIDGPYSQAPAYWRERTPMAPLRPPALAPHSLVDPEAFGQLVEFVGTDEEWFDSNDVEQYLLTTKGFKIDAQFFFVEVPEEPDNARFAEIVPQPQEIHMGLPNDSMLFYSAESKFMDDLTPDLHPNALLVLPTTLRGILLPYQQHILRI